MTDDEFIGRERECAQLASPIAEAPELGPATRNGDPATLFEAIRRALATIAARQPTAIFLDDLQWADDATLEMLPALARTLPEQPLLILAAYRSDKLPRAHPIRRMRSELRRSGRLQQVVVEPLDAAATAELVDQTLGPATPALRRVVFDRTDGIPLSVTELAAALAASGRLQQGPSGLELLDGAEVPLLDSVRDAILVRATGLSDDARASAIAAAVAGPMFDPELVRAVAGLDAWPDELLRRGLITEEPAGRMAFRHALVCDALYGDIPRTARIKLHRSVAQRLLATGPLPPWLPSTGCSARARPGTRGIAGSRQRVLRGARPS